MLSRIVCGNLRQWLGLAGIAVEAAETKRFVLLDCCGRVQLGPIPVLRLRMPPLFKEKAGSDIAFEPKHRSWEWKHRLQITWSECPRRPAPAVLPNVRKDLQSKNQEVRHQGHSNCGLAARRHFAASLQALEAMNARDAAVAAWRSPQ